MNPKIVDAIYIIIIWQSILFAIILSTKSFSKKYSNRFLALTLLTIGMQLALNFFYGNKYVSLGQFDFPIYSFGFLYGPLIYYFVRFSLRRDIYFKKQDLLHFLPFITVIVMEYFVSKVSPFVIFSRLPSIFIYCMFGLFEIYKYKKTIAQVASQRYVHETTMLILLLIITLYNSGASIIINLIVEAENMTSGNQPINVIVLMGVLAFVNLIVYLGFSKPKYFRRISVEDIEIANSSNSLITSVEEDTSKYEHLKLLSQKLEVYMKDNAIFTDSDLSLSKLAKNLKTHPKTLSQVINKIMGSNFSDYINSYRIEAAKKQLLNTNASIKEIMFAVGFNSRSVFNTFFKKSTGLTPSQYREKERNKII